MCFGLLSLCIGVVGRKSIVYGVFSDFSPHFPPPIFSTVYQCDGACLLGCVGVLGRVVRFCEPLLQSPSWSWLPIVETPECLTYPTSS